MSPFTEPCTRSGDRGGNDKGAFHQFLQRHDLRPTACSVVGDGWLPLLEDLIVDLKKLGWAGHVLHIKQRWGVLRFHVDGLDELMTTRVCRAEALSGQTCERCGQPGRWSGVGEASVLCSRCRQAESDVHSG